MNATEERPALDAGDIVKGYCDEHSHRVEGRVESQESGAVLVRSTEADSLDSLHLMPRSKCVLVERVIQPPPTPEIPVGEALCIECGERGRYRVIEIDDGIMSATPVCRKHRREAKNRGRLTSHEDLVAMWGVR